MKKFIFILILISAKVFAFVDGEVEGIGSKRDFKELIFLDNELMKQNINILLPDRVVKSWFKIKTNDIYIGGYTYYDAMDTYSYNKIIDDTIESFVFAAKRHQLKAGTRILVMIISANLILFDRVPALGAWTTIKIPDKKEKIKLHIIVIASRKRQVLYHEITHLFFDEKGLPQSEYQVEQEVKLFCGVPK